MWCRRGGAVRALAVLVALCAQVRAAPAQVEFGTIRGVVYDQDFETPLAGAVVTAVEFRRTAPVTVLVACNG